MIYVKGNLLESPVHVIAHQVNCLGIMGGGIALQIKNKWPAVFEKYKEFIADWEHCNNDLPLGYCYAVELGKERTIANIFGQKQIGGTCPTDYGAVKKAFINLKNYLISDLQYREGSQIPVGIPYKMGCGLGGGDWDTYCKVLKELEDEYNFLFIVHILE